MGNVKLLNLDGYAVLVPTAVGAHHVWQLRGCALWAHAASWTLEAPVSGTAATRDGL